MIRGTVPVRGYARTRWSRAFVDVVEGHRDSDGTAVVERADSTRITKARRYFRDRHTHRLHISAGRVTASVAGSQLEPFEVTLTMRTVDPDMVATLLRARGGVDDLMSAARGEQPAILGELLGPSEPSDISAHCSCPDDAVRCVHILAVTYEVAAEIDRSALTLLTLMGTDLPALLDALDHHAAGSSDIGHGASPIGHSGSPIGHSRATKELAYIQDDFYGDRTPLPSLPRPPRMNPLTDLDITALRAALRACGVAPGDIAEAIDELGDLYDRIIDPGM
ncbi:MAG: SWIM zinc finger family protein [Gordonia sp. (in: high G+C Gram-positive bacteria)]